MADVCIDVTNKEQCNIASGECHEDFVRLYDMDITDINSHVSTIDNTLLQINMQLTNCRGQCYDGASNISESRDGEAIQIVREEQ